MAQDRWPELCKLVATDDGLPVREAGSWTEDKLWFWSRYIDITTRAMVGHPRWPEGLVYVDLFGGPGVCKIRESGRRIPGSALIAAHAPKPFRSILVSELNGTLVDALTRRLQNSPAAGRVEVFQGDCNVRIHDISARIPNGALTLAFIDPEALHVNFKTIRTLTDKRRVDLLILFADSMDIVRNVDLYERQASSNLDSMLGENSTWRQNWPNVHNRTRPNICRFFADEYRLQLRNQLGYTMFREHVMELQGIPLYRIIYASKDEKGAEFWEKVTGKDRSGQMGLGF